MPKILDDEDLCVVLSVIDEAVDQAQEELSILSSIVMVDNRFNAELADKITMLRVLREKLSDQ